MCTQRLVESVDKKEASSERHERAREYDITYTATASLDPKTGVASGIKAASGFVRSSDRGAELEGEYTTSAWNLRNLASAKGVVNAHVPPPPPPAAASDGGGGSVCAPSLRVSMLFSTSGWVTHRHFMHELVYHHQGANVTWYGTSGDDAGAVDALMKAEVAGGSLRPEESHFALPALLLPSTFTAANLQVSP